MKLESYPATNGKLEVQVLTRAPYKESESERNPSLVANQRVLPRSMGIKTSAFRQGRVNSPATVFVLKTKGRGVTTSLGIDTSLFLHLLITWVAGLLGVVTSFARKITAEFKSLAIHHAGVV